MGQHKAPPLTRVSISVELVPDGPAPTAVLTDYFPTAWAIADAGGGKVTVIDATWSKVVWSVGDVAAGQTVTATYVLTSPPLTTPPTEYEFWSSLSFVGRTLASDGWLVMVADPASTQYLHGANLVVGSTTYNTLNVNSVSGTQDAATAAISSMGYVVFKDAAGISIFASDPAPAHYYWDISGTWTFEAYVRASSADGAAYARANLYRISQWGTAHHLTMSSQSTANAVASTAYTKVTWTFTVPEGYTIGPGERFGVEFLLDVTRRSIGATATLGFDTPTSPSDVIVQVTQNTVATPTPTPSPLPPAHAANAPYGSTPDACAQCHRAAHASEVRALTWTKSTTNTQEQVCYSYHDGTGAPDNVMAQFTTKTYKHPVAGNDLHDVGETIGGTAGDFAGTNRHVECTDCHNAHYANAVTHSQGSSAISGVLQLVSGVAASFGAGGSTPAYTFTNTPDKEAEVCFKCHSSWAYGASPPAGPSGFTETDQAVEFNQDHLAVHPIYGKGLNQSPNLPDSTFVNGWSKASTLTCSDCHGGDGTADPAGPHGSNNRWLLKSGPTTYGTTPEQRVMCFNCHNYNVYYSGSAGSRITHPVSSAHVSNATNAYGIWCLSCHGGDPQGGIHGTSRGPGTTGDPLGEHFMNGAAIATFNGLPDVSGAVTCSTKSSQDQFTSCTQHGEQKTNANYDY